MLGNIPTVGNRSVKQQSESRTVQTCGVVVKPTENLMRKKISLTSITFLLFGFASHAEEPEWAGTLERISTGVVSIRVDSTRAFDTEWNSSSQATGFVVDAKRGLILTNRHVVTPGPVVAEAVFLNNEEVRLTPIYRDPVHDFGFFRYNPDDLVYM